jgi:hypothetical protein
MQLLEGLHENGGKLQYWLLFSRLPVIYFPSLPMFDLYIDREFCCQQKIDEVGLQSES